MMTRCKRRELLFGSPDDNYNKWFLCISFCERSSLSVSKDVRARLSSIHVQQWIDCIPMPSSRAHEFFVLAFNAVQFAAFVLRRQSKKKWSSDNVDEWNKSSMCEMSAHTHTQTRLSSQVQLSFVFPSCALLTVCVCMCAGQYDAICECASSNWTQTTSAIYSLAPVLEITNDINETESRSWSTNRSFLYKMTATLSFRPIVLRFPHQN